MKMMFFFLLSVLLVNYVSAATVPGDSAYCNSTEAHQFDFWIGNWDIDQKIIQKDGSWIKTKARDSVFSILNGCAIEEHWKGNVQFFWTGMREPKPLEGLSVRYYDTKDKKWHIFWMDNFNPALGTGSKGNFKNGTGEFFHEQTTKEGKQISKISFSDITQNSCHWDLSISRDNGKTWTKVWIMEMKRI